MILDAQRLGVWNLGESFMQQCAGWHIFFSENSNMTPKPLLVS
ncbi:hypothetical protein Misp06_03393 [Microbulbifer sp. NBRC 101763]